MGKKATRTAPTPSRTATMDWNIALRPLMRRYAGRKHPLEYNNLYQLLVMVVLSSRTSDKNINAIAPAFFGKFPTLTVLSTATAEELYPYVRKVPGFRHKAEYLVSTARTIKEDVAIPLTLEQLTKLPGVGRKTANVIMSQMNVPAEGVIVDLHTLRVAPRLGIAEGTDPVKVERQLMERIEQKDWHRVGMALTYLGRETCRPTDPKCEECVVASACNYFRSSK